MKIDRGNRKLAALAMVLAALVICYALTCWLQPEPTLFGTVVTGIVLTSGATVWGNVQTHRLGNESQETR